MTFFLKVLSSNVMNMKIMELVQYKFLISLGSTGNYLPKPAIIYYSMLMPGHYDLHIIYTFCIFFFFFHYSKGYLHLEIPLQVTRLSGKAWQIVLLSAVRHLLSQHSWFIGLHRAPLCSLQKEVQQLSPLNPASHSSSPSMRPLPQTVKLLLSGNIEKNTSQCVFYPVHFLSEIYRYYSEI